MGHLHQDIADFLAAREADGYARNTFENNRKDLRIMQRVLGNPKTASISAADLDRVFAVASQTLAPSSVNNIQATLSAFFKWCRIRRRIPHDSDPLAGRRYRKVSKVDRRRVPAAQFPALLDAALNARDRMVLALGLYLMLRQSEIADLRIGDVDLQSGEVNVRIFKTHDQDVMPISAELDRELRDWLVVYQENAGPLQPGWFLVPARKFAGKQAERNELGQLVKGQLGRLTPEVKMQKVEDVAKAALVGIGWETHAPNGKSYMHGIHVLRRSSARALFDELSAQGYDGALRTVQAWLHHASTTMTERYLGLEIDRAVRNKKFRGEAMFGSLEAPNIVHLEVAGGEEDRHAV